MPAGRHIDPTEFDWNEMDIPESRDPTDPRRAIFSLESARSRSELLMADLRKTTPFCVTTLPLDGRW